MERQQIDGRHRRRIIARQAPANDVRTPWATAGGFALVLVGRDKRTRPRGRSYRSVHSRDRPSARRTTRARLAPVVGSEGSSPTCLPSGRSTPTKPSAPMRGAVSDDTPFMDPRQVPLHAQIHPHYRRRDDCCGAAQALAEHARVSSAVRGPINPQSAAVVPSSLSSGKISTHFTEPAPTTHLVTPRSCGASAEAHHTPQPMPSVFARLDQQLDGLELPRAGDALRAGPPFLLLVDVGALSNKALTHFDGGLGTGPRERRDAAMPLSTPIRGPWRP